MTHHALRRALCVLGWSGLTLAKRCKVNERTVRRWRDGQSPVPERVATWLQELVKPHDAHHPPAPRRAGLEPPHDQQHDHDQHDNAIAESTRPSLFDMFPTDACAATEAV